MQTDISFDTLFALCPTLSQYALFTSKMHSSLLSLNQMCFIISVNSILCIEFLF